METVKQIENTIAGWLKPLPRLPENVRKWLADNVWWITLIGVILSVFAAFSMLVAIIVGLWGAAVISSYYNVFGIAAAYTGLAAIWALISFAFLIVDVVIMGMAINPLRRKESKGWDLMFLAILVSAASSILSMIINFSIFTFISGIIFTGLGLAIGAYFLFEIKAYFKTAK